MNQDTATPLPLPAWFTHAIAAEPLHTSIPSLDGTPLHLASWNAHDEDKPVLLLVHGFLGNTHWWDWIAPFLTTTHRVFALDLGGMGQSGWRAEYTIDSFSDDVLAAARYLSQRSASKIEAIAHSFGAPRLLEAICKDASLFAKAIILDAGFRSEGPAEPLPAPPPLRYFDAPEPLQQRYRLVPDQPHLSYLRDHVARHSIAHKSQGWTWRFDPTLRGRFFTCVPVELMASKLQLPIDLVIGEFSNVVTLERAQHIAASLPQCRGPIIMPESYHHLMLDQPLALVTCLRSLLARVV